HQRHAIHRAMASRATHTFVHVNTVIEINEVGKIIGARPHQRLAGAEALTHRLEHGRVGPDLRVAVHARLRRRYTRIPRNLYRRVAITTVDSQPADMMLVAERHRLHMRDARIRHIWGALQLERSP